MHFKIDAVFVQEEHGVVKRAADQLVGAHHDTGADILSQAAQLLKIRPREGELIFHKQPVELFCRRVIPQAGVRRKIQPDRIARQPRLRKDDYLRAVCRSLFSQYASHFQACCHVQKNRRMLNDRDLETVRCLLFSVLPNKFSVGVELSEFREQKAVMQLLN